DDVHRSYNRITCGTEEHKTHVLDLVDDDPQVTICDVVESLTKSFEGVIHIVLRKPSPPPTKDTKKRARDNKGKKRAVMAVEEEANTTTSGYSQKPPPKGTTFAHYTKEDARKKIWVSEETFFLHSKVKELGFSEAGKDIVLPINEKYLNDGLLKLLKKLRDIFSVFVETNPSRISQLVSVGFLVM
ncbi:hypothetical protein CU098_006443, partial [Rhizopus stolonifer]